MLLCKSKREEVQLVALVMCCFLVSCIAYNKNSQQADYFDLSLEELMRIEIAEVKR